MQDQTNTNPALSRRDFLRNSSLLAAGAVAVQGLAGCAKLHGGKTQAAAPVFDEAAVAVKAPAAAPAPAAPRPRTTNKMTAVVIGFGGRGGGAAGQFLEACKVVGVEGKIAAVADIFPEQANRAQEAYGIPADKCFSGFDSYMKALEQPDVNYVILAAPPGFRAPHFKAAIEAGKHVFTEKPVAVDAPGCRMMYEAGELSKKKGLKVAAGTQRRHQADYIETVNRIKGGEIGDVVSLRAYWVNGGPIWHRGLRGDTELERQIRNWYHYIWTCGDHIVEQHVHNIDVCNWIMNNEHPVKAWGMGARQQLGDKPGEIWDNFAVEFEYPNGVRMHSYCGQVKREFASVSEAVHGSKGTANPKNMIKPNGGELWRYRGGMVDPYLQEHIDLIKAIVEDTELNETKTVTDSTLTGIMGREAAYSGKQLDWETILKSKFAYAPAQLYTDLAGMKWGDFRILQPPVPSQYDVTVDPPMVHEAKAKV